MADIFDKLPSFGFGSGSASSDSKKKLGTAFFGNRTKSSGRTLVSRNKKEKGKTGKKKGMFSRFKKGKKGDKYKSDDDKPKRMKSNDKPKRMKRFNLSDAKKGAKKGLTDAKKGVKKGLAKSGDRLLRLKHGNDAKLKTATNKASTDMKKTKTYKTIEFLQRNKGQITLNKLSTNDLQTLKLIQGYFTKKGRLGRRIKLKKRLPTDSSTFVKRLNRLIIKRTEQERRKKPAKDNKAVVKNETDPEWILKDDTFLNEVELKF